MKFKNHTPKYVLIYRINWKKVSNNYKDFYIINNRLVSHPSGGNSRKFQSDYTQH